jgi:hypothetical protein
MIPRFHRAVCGLATAHNAHQGPWGGGLPAITPSIPRDFFAALGDRKSSVKFSYLYGEEMT